MTEAATSDDDYGCNTTSECIPICVTTDPSNKCSKIPMESFGADKSTADTSRCVSLRFVQSPAPVPSDAPNSLDLVEMVRKLAAEFVGTCLLLIIVVGSGIMAQDLTTDIGLQLLINSVATMVGLYVLITIFGPLSGAHFNPIVSMVDVLYGDMNLTNFVLYGTTQISGGIVGTILANVQFEEPTKISTTERFGYHLWISEIIATCSLLVVIHGCIRTGQKSAVPSAVAAWVGGGYFFTSSSIFANPAVTLARVFTDTFAGIDPPSMGVYICFQILGGLSGYSLCRFFFPKALQPLNQDDNLYRRACVLELNDFVTKTTY